MEAFLPTPNNPSVSALLQIENCECLLTFVGHDLYRLFFSRIGCDDLSKRGHFVAKTDENSSHLQLGNCRIQLPDTTATTIYKIADEVGATISRELSSAETFLDSTRFALSSAYPGGYRLGKVPKGLWRAIHDYAERHRYFDGDGSANIFLDDRYSLRVKTKGVRQGLRFAGELVISPEPVQKPVHSLQSDEIWLVWNTFEGNDIRFLFKEDDFGSVWGVKESHDWIVQELLPIVIYDLELSKEVHRGRFIKRKVPYDTFLNNFDAERYFDSGEKATLNIEAAPTRETLLRNVQQLQTFYSRQRDVYVDGESMQGMYRALSALVAVAPTRVDLSYVAGNLGTLPEWSNALELASAINTLGTQSAAGTVNHFRVECALRSVLHLVEDERLEFEAIARASEELRRLFANAKHLMLFAKYFEESH